MNRLLHILGAVALCTAACGDDGDDPVIPETVTIGVFQVAPDAIEAGQAAKLVFSVTPSDAKVMISDVGDVTGKTTVSVTPTVTTTYRLSASKGTSSATREATVTVGPQVATAIKVEPASATPTAGDSLSVTLTAIAASGTTAPGFTGTLHLTSSDGQAVLPADVVFAAGDRGVKQVKVEFRTAGVGTVTATDIGNAARRGTGQVTVSPAAAASCAATQVPNAAAAGTALGVAVVLRDRFNNVATGYAGTIHVSATDARAVLPGDVTYVPATDAGSHAFPVELRTTGPQTLTATDTVDAAITCSATTAITPGAPRIVLTMPGDANAGFNVNVGIAVRDLFDNAIPDFAGTVTFTSTDAGSGAQTPAPVVFTGSEGGTGTATAVFVTLGSQTLSASDGAAASGSAAATIHGLVYTGPTTGRVRLVANAAQSNTRVVQLDMVANERLEVSSFFGGGPGPSATGMNLPIDTTRVGADTTLFTPGAALPPGTGTRAAAGRIGSDSVLYTVVSRKRVAGSVFNQETEVPAGGVLYSVRLRLLQNGTVGPVFDGAQPSPLFRASVRDQFGDDFVNQADFGIGRLEIR